MSWPADGEPRYVAGVITGPVMRPGVGGQNWPEGYVYDRAYCHEIVSSVRATTAASALRRASDRAAELNAA